MEFEASGQAGKVVFPIFSLFFALKYRKISYISEQNHEKQDADIEKSRTETYSSHPTPA